MNLTARVKLQPSPDQAANLAATLTRANRACNWIAGQAWDTATFGQFSLHRLVYHEARERFGLAAQMAVRAISKVADAYKLDKRTRRTFHPLGAFPYDARILSWDLAESTVSIWTLDGRQTLAFAGRERDRERLAGKRGEADLCLVGGQWFLFVACEVQTPDPSEVDGYLGVDLGIVNIATDSDGHAYSGAQVNGLRRRHRKLRQRLQAAQTRSARRLLARRRKKEGRFGRDINHQISKHIVAVAERTGRGIALEDLKGIRGRVRARRPQRATLHSWSFHQLAQFVAYKAALAGVPVVFVDPRNTSRTCPACGCIDKRNRPAQARFTCIQCGLAGPADTFAAINIARRAAVNRPNVRAGDADFQSAAPAPWASLQLLAGGC